MAELLLAFDRDLAAAARAAGCARCGGVLHSARFRRKPRGGPVGLGEVYDQRLSFCCALDLCRKRTTPPSFRFLGRKVYLGAVVVLVCAMRQGATAARQLSELFGVSRRTIARWREWWRSAFVASPFWRAAAAAFRREDRRTRYSAAHRCRGHRACMRTVERCYHTRYSRQSSFDRSVGSASIRREGMPRAWRRQPAPFQADCPQSSSGSPPNAASRHNPHGPPGARSATPRVACAEWRDAAPSPRNTAHSWTFRKHKRHRRSDSLEVDRLSHKTGVSKSDRHLTGVPAIADRAPGTTTMSGERFRARRLRKHQPDRLLHTTIGILLETLVIRLHVANWHRHDQLATARLLAAGRERWRKRSSSYSFRLPFSPSRRRSLPWRGV